MIPCRLVKRKKSCSLLFVTSLRKIISIFQRKDLFIYMISHRDESMFGVFWKQCLVLIILQFRNALHRKKEYITIFWLTLLSGRIGLFKSQHSEGNFLDDSGKGITWSYYLTSQNCKHNSSVNTPWLLPVQQLKLHHSSPGSSPQ